MIPAIAVGLGLAAHMFGASSLVAKEVIRAGDTVTAANASTESGAIVDADNPLIGREVRRTVYVGQELSMDDTRPPRLIRR
ncbi:MAG: flagella basal body P-ring formation protein FlgA, partial [Hyphomonas sp.]